MACEICGHFLSHMHRLYLGEWGGRYRDDNIANLCPNHHAAVHLLTDWFYKGSEAISSPWIEQRFLEYHADKPLMKFFASEVKPVVIRRLQEEGRWHPYVRTLPDNADEIAKKINAEEKRKHAQAIKKGPPDFEPEDD